MELPRPKNQKQEVLNLLLEYKNGLTRHDLMALAFVQNAPEIIRRLRYDEMVAIHRVDIEKKSKFGKTAVFGRYVLTDPKKARKHYLEMVKRKK